MQSKRAQARPLLVIGLFGIVAAAIYLFIDSSTTFAVAVYFHWAMLIVSAGVAGYGGWLLYQDSRPSSSGNASPNGRKPADK